MDKHQQNIEIAKILGFEILDNKQVVYPPDWENETKCVPVRNIPDFIQMLTNYRKIADELKYGIPTDFKAVKQYKDES
jgi:signal recognition particle subunit SEC65